MFVSALVPLYSVTADTLAATGPAQGFGLQLIPTPVRRHQMAEPDDWVPELYY